MTDRVGQQFGSYRLTRLIDEGGTAEVYLGQHIRVKERQTAIKILHEFVLDEKSLRDFQREAAILAKLKHPHITQLLDFGVEDDIPFIVMTYAPGGNLEKKHPLGQCVPLNEIFLYVKQIGEVLQYSHEHNVVHCDLKPNNLLIASDGDLLVADFGFARLLHATSRSQTSHKLGANFFYCAPEQFELQPPNPASDQYALGVIIYQWLCGKRPFDGIDPELLYKHLNEPPPPLHHIIPDFPLQIEHVVLKALAKEPQQRFATIQQFVTAFGEATHLIRSISSLDTLQSSPNLVIDQLQETPPADFAVQLQETAAQSLPTLNEQTKKTSYGCAIATFLGGLLLLGFMLFLCPLTDIQSVASTQEFLQQATVHVQGTVISVINSTTSNGNGMSSTGCYLTIGFQPAPASEYHPTIIHDGGCALVGDKVNVVYRPHDPEKAQNEGTARFMENSSIVMLIIAVIISLLVVGVGVGLIVSAYRRKGMYG